MLFIFVKVLHKLIIRLMIKAGCNTLQSGLGIDAQKSEDTIDIR